MTDDEAEMLMMPLGIVVTPWFPPTINPARPGVYQVRPRFSRFTAWRRWNGKHWMGWTWELDRAAVNHFPGGDRLEWRGLASPPKEQR